LTTFHPFAGPVPWGRFLPFWGMWCHIADVISRVNIKSIGQGFRGLRLPKIGGSHWLWLCLLLPCHTL